MIIKPLYVLLFALVVGLTSSATIWAQTVLNPAPCGIAGAYNATPQTITTGNFGLVQVDINGKLVIAP